MPSSNERAKPSDPYRLGFEERMRKREMVDSVGSAASPPRAPASSPDKETIDRLKRKMRKMEAELARGRELSVQHQEVRAMLVAVKGEHARTQRRLMAATKKERDTVVRKTTTPKKLPPNSNQTKKLEGQVQELANTNRVLTGEVGRLRQKLNEYRQHPSLRVAKSPGKSPSQRWNA